MEHGPAVKLGKDNAIGKKSKMGIIMFIFYFAIYAGFVGINTLKPKLMGKIIFMGLNLAVLYGFGLIIFAIVLGLIYNKLCSDAEIKMNGKGAVE